MFLATHSETNFTSFQISLRHKSKDGVKHEEIWVPVGDIRQALHRGSSM